MLLKLLLNLNYNIFIISVKHFFWFLNPPSRLLRRTGRLGVDSPQLAEDKSPELALGFIPLIGQKILDKNIS
jgi:hypothetical protein